MKFTQWLLIAAQAFTLVLSPVSFAAPAASTKHTAWEYDAGPNPADPAQKELIDIIASMPHFPGVSEQLTGEQKFRLIFGPVFWRMTQQKNSMKILFIGQDATHIAEAAERTATAGFGGRAQDLANYLGVDRGAGFINTYAYTIYGQAASFNTPYFYLDGKGGAQARFGSFVENPLWLMTYDQRSQVVVWRNRFIDWIIRNNRDSLRLIVGFGGAARDAIGAFIEGRGGRVGTRVADAQLKNIKVPLIRTVSAGGNNEFPILLDRKGDDLYEKLAGRRLNYKNEADQKAAQKALQDNIERALGEAAIGGGGSQDSGIVHAAQLGGYDLDRIEVRGGTVSRNLKDLVLSDGKTLGRDVVVAEFPHPTRLSMMEPPEAAKAVAEGLKDVQEYARKIPADEGFVNQFAAGKPYAYGRASIGPEFYSFGTPLSRQVSVSSALRMHGKPNVIIFGSRDEVDFGTKLVEELTAMRPAEPVNPGEIFTGRPRLPDSRYVFDLGPGLEWAKLMKENLDLDAIYKTKPGKSWKTDGINAFNVKTLPDHGDFGHYRGTFENPRVLVLADPDGVDDMITSRALTGARGQYLQGLMNDLGVDDQYLVIKTVPFGMDGATAEEWETVLQQTQKYRDEVVGKLLDEGKYDAVVTDGEYAAREIARLTKGSDLKIVNIAREGLGNDSGIVAAGKELAALKAFKGARVSGKRANIPRSHLTYYAHVWEGTSGDSVIYAKDKDRGLAFALIAPAWAFKQKVELDAVTARSVRDLQAYLVSAGLFSPGGSIPSYMAGKPAIRALKPALRQAN